MTRRYHGRVAVVLASMLSVVLLVVAMPGPAAGADRPYVALGDSVGAGLVASTEEKSYVGLLYSAFQSNLGVTQVLNRSRSGESSGSLRTGGQLATALADINAASDTAVVTLEIGGNDRFTCRFIWGDPSCPFRANFGATLDDLAAALANDFGGGLLATTMYYNPASGTGTAQEADFDTSLLGANGAVGASDSGADVGLNDVIYQEATERSLPVANPYPAFKAGGQAFIADGLHPSDAGHAAMALAFCEAMMVPCGLTSPPVGGPPTPPPPPNDTDAPETTITKRPPNRIERSSPKFKFHSDEAGATFECKRDKRAWKACSSPKKVKNLDEGKHKFKVRATDLAGNLDSSPAKDRFRVVD